ncbi:MAG: AAA family ATPase [Saprospiraceae bacterium]|nr:AAA family ATPase [Saprospiraceae bacterium]
MEEQYNIKLKHLELKNFRCFESLDIIFDSKLTVLIAGNGSGKTAFLDAVAEGLKGYLSALNKGYKLSSFKGTDVRTGTAKSDNNLAVDLSYPVQLGYLDEGNNDIEIDEKSDVDVLLHTDIDIDGGSSFRMSSLSVVASYKQLAEKKVNSKSGNNIVLPILAYYGGNSVDTDYDSAKKAKNRIDYIYKDALSSSRFNFAAFFDWFLLRYNMYSSAKLKSSEKDMLDIDPNLFQIISAVEVIMNDDINHKTYQDLRIEYSEEGAKLVLGKLNDKNEYDPFEIRQLSAGEQALFAFVADLGLRLLKANPKTNKVSDDGFYKIKGSGVVLIDEVDLHLHPKWQKKIVGKLMDIFPDVQFVMTTHSPFVVGQSHFSQTVYSIQDNKAIEEPYAGGHSSDYILSELMDIDPKNQDVEDYIALIRQGLHETEEGKKLHHVIEKLDPNSSDMMRINFALQRLKSKK